MILLWGLPGDTPLTRVRHALARLGAHVAFVDQGAVLSTGVEFTLGSDLTGRICSPAGTTPLEDVTAVYLRPYSSIDLPAVRQAGWGSPAWQHALCLDDALLSWTELTPALVVNRPSAMASNGSKPYQTSLIQRFGFAVPATLLTTDPAAVLEFWEQHGTVVYKSISGVRSIVARLSSSRLVDLEKVRWCPTQFQQHIRGRDYRVHVVGDDVFPCEVLSAADDYRYDPDTVGRRACVLPADIAERCRTMAAALGLVVAGIDLRRAPEDEWYCFEVNPSPAFTYYEEATGQPMAVAIAALLMKGHSASHAFVPV